MKKIYSKISLYGMMILIFINCNSNSNNDSGLKKKVGVYKPLFMTLHPHETTSEFFNKIKRLNKEGKLEKGKFILKLNNAIFSFDVIKRKNSIGLWHTQKEEWSYSTLSYEKSDLINTKYQNILNTIKQIFDDKYVLNEKQIPLQSQFYFENMNYTLYKDKDKYILFGYKLQKERIGNAAEREEEMNRFLERTMGKESYKKDVNSNSRELKWESSDDPTQTFGLKIIVDYFEKKYIDSILIKIDKEIKKAQLEKNKIKLKLEKESQRREDNVKSI